MIVLLALLNDLAIITIAYDRAEYSNKPDRWNMQSVLGLATFLGIIGTFVSFGILFIGLDILHLSRETLQSMIYLKLSVAGNFTIFIAMTRGFFWVYRPSYILLGAILGTQTLATIIAVYGILIPPIGWSLAGLVWAYAMIAFVITDLIYVKFHDKFVLSLKFLEEEAKEI